MPGSPELPPRPLPPRAAGELAGAWLRWFGVGRLMPSALSVVVVLAGAAWLLRAPAPATEARPAADGIGRLGAGADRPDARTRPRRRHCHVARRPRRRGGGVARCRTDLPGAHVWPTPSPPPEVPQPTATSTGSTWRLPLVDGQRVYVPRSGEVDPATRALGGAAPTGPSCAGDPAPRHARPQSATAARARNAARASGRPRRRRSSTTVTRNGPFASVDDLDRVPGIGAAKLDRSAIAGHGVSSERSAPSSDDQRPAQRGRRDREGDDRTEHHGDRQHHHLTPVVAPRGDRRRVARREASRPSSSHSGMLASTAFGYAESSANGAPTTSRPGAADTPADQSDQTARASLAEAQRAPPDAAQ